MKRFFLLVLLLGATVAARAATASRTNLSTGVLAIVDNTVITYGDLELNLRPILGTLELQYGNDPKVWQEKVALAEKETLDGLIDRQLVLREFKTQGYNLPESYIEDMIQRDIRDHYGSRTKLINTLHEQGETYETYRQRTREGFIFRQLIQKNISGLIFISPEKIERFYREHKDEYKLEDQVKLRMIWLKARPDRPLNATKQLAEEIRTKLKSGASFTEMATIYSDGETRTQGGESDWMERKAVRDELRELAFTLPKGQPSEVKDYQVQKRNASNALLYVDAQNNETTSAAGATPVILETGVYLMLVEDVKLAHVQPLNEKRDEIEKTLLDQEKERLRKLYLKKLREKAFVRYF